MPLPLIAIVGRPNVGKSTLVNRLAQTTAAIVHSAPGVTRDRSYHRADWNGRDFMLIDTGGIEFGGNDAFGGSIRDQALTGVEEADMVIFLVDGTLGQPVSDDLEVARILKRSERPVFLAVNKLDNPSDESSVHSFWSLGLGTPWPISAAHGHGTGDLLDAIVDALPPAEPEEDDDAIGVAIIGRPNAGKSTLLNHLSGVERAIVSEVAGTTRDTIDSMVERDGVRYRLIDTAGLRRQSRIDESVEYYGFVRAMRAMDRADVALLVIDSTVGVTDQDQRIAVFAQERGCALAILLNKWDTFSGVPEDREHLEEDIPRKLGFVSYAPILRISATTGRGTHRVLDVIDTCYASYTRKIPTSQLNKLLTELRDFGHTVNKGRKTLKLHYVTQTRVGPPGFTFFANHPMLVDDSYHRYLENRMREAFDFIGTPIRLGFRQKG